MPRPRARRYSKPARGRGRAVPTVSSATGRCAAKALGKAPNLLLKHEKEDDANFALLRVLTGPGPAQEIEALLPDPHVCAQWLALELDGVGALLFSADAQLGS